ncbi:pyrimidine 2, partial [Tanacetum coccineum]
MVKSRQQQKFIKKEEEITSCDLANCIYPGCVQLHTDSICLEKEEQITSLSSSKQGPEAKAPEFYLLQLEDEAAARAICLAAFVNTPLYVVHVMSTDAMEEIARAQRSGQRVIVEHVVSGLILNDYVVWDPDFITAAKQVCHEPPNKSIRARENSSTKHCPTEFLK